MTKDLHDEGGDGGGGLGGGLGGDIGGGGDVGGSGAKSHRNWPNPNDQE